MDTQIAKQKEAEKFSDQQNLRKLGCKGQARPCSRSIGDYDGVHPIRIGLGDGVQGRAKSPLGHGGVGGAGTLRLTGDATAIRCTGFDDLRKRCPACIAGIWASGWRFGEAGLPEGMQRGTRSGCPLPRLRWYYHRHLADHAKA